MRKTSTSRAVLCPRCRFCGRSWMPEDGVSAIQAYCGQCSAQRRELALGALGGPAPDAIDPTGRYFLPRHLRPSRA